MMTSDVLTWHAVLRGVSVLNLLAWLAAAVWLTLRRGQLSPEERARMKLLRELSRLQDEQSNLRSQTRKLHERWREAVDERAAEDGEREAAATEPLEV